MHETIMTIIDNNNTQDTLITITSNNNMQNTVIIATQQHTRHGQNNHQKQYIITRSTRYNQNQQQCARYNITKHAHTLETIINNNTQATSGIYL